MHYLIKPQKLKTIHLISKPPILILRENVCCKHVLVCFTLQGVRKSNHRPTFECSKKKQNSNCYFRVLKNITTKFCPPLIRINTELPVTISMPNIYAQ